ncbi:MAG: FkbM family methyltransferase [Verrucomicrobiota bacterium]
MDSRKIKVAQIEHDGQTFAVKYRDEFVGNTMEETHQFWEIDFLEKVAKLYPIHKTIVDIGAHIGSAALYFKHFLKPKRLIAIEPAQDNYMFLVQNVPGAIYLKMALSNRNGEGYLWNRLETVNAGTYQLGDQGEPITLRTLDSLNLDDVTLIKIDVEEHEREVLEGGMGTIKRCKPIILLELHKPVNTPEFHRWVQQELGYKFHESCPFYCDINAILEPA